MNRRTGLLFCALSLLIAAPSLRAQTAPAPAQAAAPAPAQQPGLNITFRDGKSTIATALKRSGANVMATVQMGAAAGEIGYPVATIAKIDFPEPPQIKAAGDLLEQGKAVDALAQIGPIVNYYASFKDVAGNFWLPAARLKFKALIDLQRDDESAALLDEIVKSSSDPEAGRFARVLLAASWARKGDHEKAIAACDEVIQTGTSEETLARAWLEKANSLLALKDYDPALLAYLHVPVFYPRQKSLLPPAMLGSGRAFAGLDDLQNAEKAFNDLTSQFPNSPETAAAKAELKKITKAPAADQKPGAGNP